MSESTNFCNFSTPFSAITIFLPNSIRSGLVTADMISTSGLISFASFAITGDAPVPVPPPIPATIKSKSVSASISVSSFLDSSAACSPIAGSAPAP